MTALALLIALGVLSSQEIDTAAVYSTLLQAVRGEHPGRVTVLSETWSDVECMPHCSTSISEDRAHSEQVLQRLRTEGLIQAQCRVGRSSLGCGAAAGRLFVALGEIRPDTPEGGQRVDGGVWVMVVTVAPCTGSCRFPNAAAYRYLLKQEGSCWRVVRRRPEWVV